MSIWSLAEFGESVETSLTHPDDISSDIVAEGQVAGDRNKNVNRGSRANACKNYTSSPERLVSKKVCLMRQSITYCLCELSLISFKIENIYSL
jgi:hypothetical protein